MQIIPTEAAGLTHRFQVIVPASDMQSQMENELQSIGKRVKMPGFRQGKVPMPVLKKRYAQEVLGEVIQSTANKAAREVVEQKNLRAALQPDVKITNYVEDGDLTLEVTVEAMPDVPEVAFDKITVDELTFEVPDSEIDEALARLAKSRQHPHTKEGAAVLGDVVKIDFKGLLDGVAFDGGTAKNFQLELGSGQFIPGFEDQLVGVAAGDERNVNVSFPEQYHSADLAGKPVVFEVKVHEVAYLHVPDADDKLAEKLGFKDLVELKDKIREQIATDYQRMARNKAKKQLFDKLDEVVTFPVPRNMLSIEMDNIWKQVEEAKKAGDPELKDKSDEELKKEYSKIAERRVKLGILLSEVGRTNNLQITREEISAAVMNHARNFPGQEDKVFEFYRKNPQQVEQLRGPILEEKAVDFVLSKVKRKSKAISIDELLKTDDAEVA